MSSYYPSFNYMGLNSCKDKNLIVVHFESGDDGEMDTFLGMDQIYADNAYGTRRLSYGAKYNSVAVIRISVMKANGQDFTVAEVRDFLRWTTGSRQVSYLDLVDGEIVKASFLGNVTAVYQQKLDARTVGFVIEHTSIGPWAYSPIQYIRSATNQLMGIDNNDVLYKNDGSGTSFAIDENGVLYDNPTLNIDNNGAVYIGEAATSCTIFNDTDDLYTPVYLNTVFENKTSTSVSIKNLTLNEETIITNIRKDEVITLSAEQFITSNIQNKLFGNDFNFIWPRLAPGTNQLAIKTDGDGDVLFTYRYPIKIGDCAIDISVSNGGLCCGDSHEDPGSAPEFVSWDQIIGKPSTVRGYGITDAYTKYEVDDKIDDLDMQIDEDELNEMLNDVFE